MHPVHAFALAAALPLAAQAQSYPGRVDPPLVGDWQCGDTRTYITKLGSIELLTSGYRAGLFDAADGTMKILWDEGGETEWSYSANDDGITLTPPDEPEYSCVARE